MVDLRELPARLARAQGADTDGQEAAIATVREEFAALAAAAGIADARLQLSGPGLFAVKSRATIKSEITRLSAIGTLTIIAVLFFVYRSLRLLTLGLLPVLSGALAGVVAVSLAYGTVFGITVGFGSALIGEAVDYSIYYFVQSGRSGVAAWKTRFWPTIRLGVLTSVCGFGALLFSGFPGLAQLGLYALTGIATAAIVTRFVLPRVADGGAAPRDLSRLGATLQNAMTVLRRLRWPTLALALAATTYLALHHDRLWSPNLSVLSSVSRADAELDTALRADLGTSDSRFMVVVRGADREAALQAAERAGQALDRLLANGAIETGISGGWLLSVVVALGADMAERLVASGAEVLQPFLELRECGPVVFVRLEGFPLRADADVRPADVAEAVVLVKLVERPLLDAPRAGHVQHVAQRLGVEE